MSRSTVMLNLSLGTAAQPGGPMLSPTDIHTKVVPGLWHFQFELSLSFEMGMFLWNSLENWGGGGGGAEGAART